jgi:hypothetical protein
MGNYNIITPSVVGLIRQTLLNIKYGNTGGSGANADIAYNALANIAEQAKRYSDLGTPVVNPVVWSGGSYNKYDGGMIVQVQTPDFVLPYATVIDFSRAKNVIKTSINGHDGNVKEMFGSDDWQIRIQGLILEQNGKTVDEIKSELLVWESLADTIKIKEGTPFTEKGIYGIFIEDISLPQLKGFPDVQPFEINAVSDSLDLWLIE